MSAKSNAMKKHRSVIFEKWGRQSVTDDDSSERGITTRDTFGKRDHVGLVIKTLTTKPVAETAEPTNHFVGDQ